MNRVTTLAAYLALNVAVFIAYGAFHPVGIGLVLLALVLSGISAVGRSPTRMRQSSAELWWLMLSVVVASSLVMLCAYPLTSPVIPRSANRMPLLIGVTAMGVACLGYLRPHSPWARWALPITVTAFIGTGCWNLYVTQSPGIDVWHLQQGACERLLQGKNPYTGEYENIYSHAAFYGPGVLKDNKVQSYPYPPISLLLALPAYALVGDVRLGLLVMVAITSAAMAATLRRHGLKAGHPMELLAVSPLVFPLVLFLLSSASTEPLMAMAAAMFVYGKARHDARLSTVSLGLALAAKQYAILLCLPLIATRQVRGRELLGALTVVLVVTLPFLIWDPAAFFRGTVALHFKQPFRDHALSVLVLIKQLGGPELPSVLGFAAAFTTAGLLWRRMPQELPPALVGAAAIFLAFFAFNKQAWLNYYWLCGNLLLLSLVASSEREQPDR